MSTIVSRVPTLVTADTGGAPFAKDLALCLNRENGRFSLLLLGADGTPGAPVLEVEPHGNGWKLRPLASPGPGWATEAGWPVVSGYSKDP